MSENVFAVAISAGVAALAVVHCVQSDAFFLLSESPFLVLYTRENVIQCDDQNQAAPSLTFVSLLLALSFLLSLCFQAI